MGGRFDFQIFLVLCFPMCAYAPSYDEEVGKNCNSANPTLILGSKYLRADTVHCPFPWSQRTFTGFMGQGFDECFKLYSQCHLAGCLTYHRDASLLHGITYSATHEVKEPTFLLASQRPTCTLSRLCPHLLQHAFLFLLGSWVFFLKEHTVKLRQTARLPALRLQSFLGWKDLYTYVYYTTSLSTSPTFCQLRLVAWKVSILP